MMKGSKSSYSKEFRIKVHKEQKRWEIHESANY
jgi:hypothetical protein